MNTQTINDIAQAEQGTSLWKDAWLRLRKNHLAVFGLRITTAHRFEDGVAPGLDRE